MARGKDISDFDRGLIVGTQMAGASVKKTAHLAAVSVGTVTSVFRSMEKTSVNRIGNCGRQGTFDDCDTCV